MKRDEIRGIIPDITDEALDKIMRLNGDDINNAKGDTKKLEDDLKAAQDTIKTLEENKGNAEQLQKELDDYKQKEADRKKAEEEAAVNKAISDRFDGCVGDKEFINVFTRNGIFEEFK